MSTTSSRGCCSARGEGRPGEVYFVTDGEPVVFREFLTELLATQGVEPPGPLVPTWAARVPSSPAARAAVARCCRCRARRR